MKTNKSVKKRMKVTKSGKILARKSGHGHFNAKQKRTKQLGQKKSREIELSNKKLGKYLPLEN